MSIAGLALWALVALIVVVGLGFFARAVCDNPRNDPNTGMLSALLRLYTRLVHRVRYEGLSLIPPAGEPTLFVCNHTAGIDPMLVHLVSGHDIRWMMARDMRTPILETFWNWMRIIDVDRIAGDPAAAREALRELAQGGTVGIFPEGGLERPARGLDLQLTYVFLDARDLQRERALSGRQSHQCTFRVRYAVPGTGFSAVVRGSVVGERPCYETDASGDTQEVRDDPYLSLDARVEQTLGDYVAVFAGADNLAGAGGRYLNIRPRGFYAGLRLDY